MTTKKHPRDLTADEADAIIAGFDDHEDDAYSVTDAATLSELRAAAASRREADARGSKRPHSQHTVRACHGALLERNSG